MCIVCHTTAFEKRYDAVAATPSSRAGRSPTCRASRATARASGTCNGRNAKGGQDGAEPPDERYGLSVDVRPRLRDSRSTCCAACHSRRSDLDALPAARPAAARQLPALRCCAEGLYHADGQQLDEVYVDGSFRQSKMYRMGVACTNCHNAHTGKPKLAGNALCLQCHQPQANPAFASAAGSFDSPAHHFHKDGSAGARASAATCRPGPTCRSRRGPTTACACRGPTSRSRSARPTRARTAMPTRQRNGRPTRSRKWYGPTAAPGGALRRGVRRGARGQSARGQALVKLIADAQNAPIVRATALAIVALRRRSGASSERSRRRATSIPRCAPPRPTASKAAPATQRVDALRPAAARPGARRCGLPPRAACSSLPPHQLGADARPAFEAALAEYIAAQNVALDMPGASPQPGRGLREHRSSGPGRAALPRRAEDRSRLHAGTSQPGPALQRHLAQRRRRARAAAGASSECPSSASCSIRWGCCWPRNSACPRPPRRSPKAAQLLPAARPGSLQPRPGAAATGPAQAGRDGAAAGAAPRPVRRGDGPCAGDPVCAERSAGEGTRVGRTVPGPCAGRSRRTPVGCEPAPREVSAEAA